MTNEPLRHVHLRLARQRTAPSRVRARVREQEPVPEPEATRTQRAWQRIRRVRWAHDITVIVTVLGAVTAIGGLIGTAVATYYGAAVSADQLNQSREAADAERRAQAVLVSAWVETGSRGKKEVHVQNRSPDAVYNAEFAFSGPIEPGPPRDFTVVFITNLDSVPPCSELVIEQSALRYRKTREAGPVIPNDPEDTHKSSASWKPVSSIQRLHFNAITFVDRNGQAWERPEVSAQVQEIVPPAQLSERWWRPTRWQGGIQGEPVVRPAKACGESAG